MKLFRVFSTLKEQAKRDKYLWGNVDFWHLWSLPLVWAKRSIPMKKPRYDTFDQDQPRNHEEAGRTRKHWTFSRGDPSFEVTSTIEDYQRKACRLKSIPSFNLSRITLKLGRSTSRLETDSLLKTLSISLWDRILGLIPRTPGLDRLITSTPREELTCFMSWRTWERENSTQLLMMGRQSSAFKERMMS